MLAQCYGFESQGENSTSPGIPDTSLPSQTSLSNSDTLPGINSCRLYIVAGALAGTMTTLHIYQQNGWWKDNRRSFHFQEDLVYSLGVDKIGHFYGTSALAFTISKSLQWANMEEKQSLWYGAGGGLLFETFLEIEDGFSTWGFDRVDFLADVGGALWPIGQYHFSLLREVDLKLSYHPSPLLDNSGGTGFKGQKHIVGDDYEGQTFWLSTHLRTILPSPIKQSVPEFLCLALGYGSRDILGEHGSPYRVWLIALDIDVRKILPVEIPWVKTLSESINFIHLPMPAVQISPSTIWYGVYF